MGRNGGETNEIKNKSIPYIKKILREILAPFAPELQRAVPSCDQ